MSVLARSPYVAADSKSRRGKCSCTAHDGLQHDTVRVHAAVSLFYSNLEEQHVNGVREAARRLARSGSSSL